MTRANPRGAAGSVPPRGSAHPDRKAVLVCPRCGHESPVDGDWIHVLDLDRYEVRCPDCRERLTVRPLGRAT